MTNVVSASLGQRGCVVAVAEGAWLCGSTEGLLPEHGGKQSFHPNHDDILSTVEVASAMVSLLGWVVW
jgi:hypothetical protein